MTRHLVVSDDHGDAINALAERHKRDFGSQTEACLESDPEFAQEIKKIRKAKESVKA